MARGLHVRRQHDEGTKWYEGTIMRVLHTEGTTW